MSDTVQEPFAGRIGRTYRDSVPSWPSRPTSTGRPNVVFVVLDDMGFGSLGCYGSEIDTPVMDRLAAEGVQFTNFHATALCSPTRASLLTGRNHHAVGMAYLSHVDDGYPGYRGRITHRAATLAEMVREHGYNTFAVGKWHLTPMDETTAAGPYDQWPLGRGFERYYGFLEGLTDHYFPELYSDNSPVPPPDTRDEDYHLTTDLIDRSIGLIRDQTSMTPEKPFFLYLAFGATHTPFQAPADFVAKYHGRYDEGWDVIRRRRYERQLETGVIPAGTELPPANEGVPAWADLDPQAQRLYARFQEVYAGFLDHTDHELGRLVAYLEEIGRLEDTIVVVVSDNGASQEGGPHGVLDTTSYENGRFPSLAENLARLDEIDGRTAHVNYPLGWAQAGNTPLKRYKQNTHAGGIRTAMIVRPPRALADLPRGGIRDQFHHVTDIVPTVLDLIGIEPPAALGGLPQLPIDGVSMRRTLTDPTAAIDPRAQYFETLGHRAIWKNGWKAVAFHQRGADYDEDRWELYHLEQDFSESTDLAAQMPDKLAELVDAWWAEAGRNKVLPLDDRGFAERATVNIRPDSPRNRSRFVFHNGMHHIGTGAAPVVAGHPFEISAAIERPAGVGDGVLLAFGSVNSGFALLVRDGHLEFDFNHYGTHHITRTPQPLPAGDSAVAVRVEPTGRGTACDVTLLVDAEPAASSHLAETFEHFVAFQGLDVGGDRLSPVRAGGDGPFPFTGTLRQVVIELLDGGPGRGHEVND
ncbi:arylsulfatase [Dactylosporangium sp. NPDC000244]|uniref:arylsulfatase n=1 Tax=Dactylosporangium sp. NPDC000244 TaxID=3154365 RepID=UPI00332B3F62